MIAKSPALDLALSIWGKFISKDWYMKYNLSLQFLVWKTFKKHRTYHISMSLKIDSLSKLSVSTQFSSVTQSCLTLQPHGLQHARLPCPSPTPEACSNSCPLSQGCHPTISSSIVPFSSRLQSFPSSGSFQMSQFFASGGQSIGASASASVLPMNIQDWFPVNIQYWLVWSPCSPRGSQESSPTPQFKSINSSVLSFLYSPTLTSIHDYLKTHSFN